MALLCRRRARDGARAARARHGAAGRDPDALRRALAERDAGLAARAEGSGLRGRADRAGRRAANLEHAADRPRAAGLPRVPRAPVRARDRRPRRAAARPPRLRARTRPAALRLTADLPRDPPRVPPHSADGLGGDAAFVQRLTLAVEDRHIDPAEVLPEARAPEHVGDVEDAAVLENGKAVLHADGPRHLLDARLIQVARLHPDARGAALEHVRPHLAAERRSHGEDPGRDEPQDRYDDSTARVLDPDRDLPLVGPR